MTVLYEKRGRRYYPVHDTAALDGLANGTWYVDVKGGRHIAVRTEDSAPIFSPIAAIPALTQIICDAISEAAECRLRTGPRPASEKEREAFAAWTAIMGEDRPLILERPSIWDIAVNVARRITELADRTSDAEARDSKKELSLVRYPDVDCPEDVGPC